MIINLTFQVSHPFQVYIILVIESKMKFLIAMPIYIAVQKEIPGVSEVQRWDTYNDDVLYSQFALLSSTLRSIGECRSSVRRACTSTTTMGLKGSFLVLNNRANNLFHKSCDHVRRNFFSTSLSPFIVVKLLF